MPAFLSLLRLAALLLIGAPVATLAAQTVHRVPVDGTVEMGLAPFVKRALSEAEAAGAAAVVLDINTPGGRIDAAQQITDAVRDAGVPVYALVNRRALSAGAMIALAADRIYMRPGSLLGAATPVTGGGETAPEKVVSVMRSEFRALAAEQGLDPRVAEAMVDPDIEIEGVVERGKLLTLSTGEAVALGFARETADFAALLGEIGSAGATVERARANWAERLVRFLTNPLVAPFLLSLGFLGLLIEIKTPGFGLPGLVGITFLGAFFGSHYIIGLAGWESLILLAAGVLLLLLEALVIPGFGIAGVLGIAAVVASIFLSMIGSFPTASDFATAAAVIAVSVVAVTFIGWQLARRLPADRRARGVFLTESTSRESGYASSDARPELVGREGVALTDLRPAGSGRFGDERLDVVSDGPWIEAGAPIRVLHAEGYRHVVQRIANSES
ncbi:MAG: NfeD family protein [Longimicrobiaceae bacterium]